MLDLWGVTGLNYHTERQLKFPLLYYLLSRKSRNLFGAVAVWQDGSGGLARVSSLTRNEFYVGLL